MINVLIADDEPLALASLKYSIKELTNWQLVGSADNGLDALKQINEYCPDVVLLDINMPHLNGLELSKQLQACKVVPLIIFITAYDNYAVDAFAHCAFDYLLKPYDDNRFRFMVERVEKQLASDTPLSDENTKFLVKSIGKIQVVNSADIHWIESAGNYVSLHLFDTHVLHRISLNQIAQLLPTQFIRIHRKYIICIEQLDQLTTDGDGHHFVILRDGTQLSVSDSYKQSLMKALS